MTYEVGEETIIEGFICPQCLVSYGTADILRLHFQSVHQSSQHSFGGARKQVAPETITLVSGSLAYYDLPQKREKHLGFFNSITKEFAEQRKYRLNRSALESSSLLIRLEKLVTAVKNNYANIKEVEKTVVPWIDNKVVKLCPSCGNSFGFGVETAFPEDVHDAPTCESDNSPKNCNRLLHVARAGKQKVTQLTNALLDYNPVYRRHHHCRLCGHVLCADCSLFIPISVAERLLSQVDYGQGADPITNALQYLYDEEHFVDKKRAHLEPQDPSIDGPSSYAIRSCAVCKNLLWRKWGNSEVSKENSSIFRLHTELRNHMKKVTEGSGAYLSIATSLSCGEQKYALDVARTMREELFDHMQAIDSIRRRWENALKQHSSGEMVSCETGLQFNSAGVRLLRSAACFARQFLQENLPTLRVLPTLQQYESLTAQRRDELALRWQQEDDALLELEKRLDCTGTIQSPTERPKPIVGGKAETPSAAQHKLMMKQTQLAEAMDSVTAKLLASNDPFLTKQLMEQLNSLEKEITALSS